MYVKPHIDSSKKEKNNLGSCKDYAEYLCKENEYFFNHFSDKIALKEAIKMIDAHSKGQLLKMEAKWYAPVYSLSEREARHICLKLFEKHYIDYDELSEKEKEIYNRYAVELGRKFQDSMADNFNKSDIGIVDGRNLCYVGVVENRRFYKGFDEEVKHGDARSGQKKLGFNTHVHIIQSRKALTEKKSKISPMQNHKKMTTNCFNAKVGFDRNNLKNVIEQKFDYLTEYQRKEEEKFINLREYFFKRKYNSLRRMKPENEFRMNFEKGEFSHIEKFKCENGLKVERNLSWTEATEVVKEEILKLLRNKRVEVSDLDALLYKYIPKVNPTQSIWRTIEAYDKEKREDDKLYIGYRDELYNFVLEQSSELGKLNMFAVKGKNYYLKAYIKIKTEKRQAKNIALR